MKTKKHFIAMAFVAIITLAFAIIGCKEDEPEPPPPIIIPPPNEVSVGGFKVIINNYELLSAEKFALLKEVIPLVLAEKTLTGNLTINVISGSDGFTKTGSKTLSVGASWVSVRDKSQIGSGLSSAADTWIA